MANFRKTAYFYIFREVVTPTFIALFVFTFVMLANQLVRMLDLVFSKGVDPIDIVLLFASILPTFLILMIPISLMVGILLGMGRMSADSEIVAFKASGIGLKDIFKPVAFLAIISFVLVNIMIFVGLPEGKKYFDNKLYEIARKKATIGIKPRVFNDSFEGMTLFVDNIDPQKETLQRVMIHDSEHFEKPLTLLASEGRITSHDASKTITLHLENGQALTEGSEPGVIRTISFDSYKLNLSLLEEDRRKGVPLSALPLDELLEIENRELEHRSNNPALLWKVQAEIHRKFAVPFSCLVLALAAFPLGIFPPRSVRARGFVTGMVIFLVYYILSVGGLRSVRAGAIPAWLGMWSANIAIGAFGIAAFVKSMRESQFRFLELIGDLVDRISRSLGKAGQ